MVDFPTPGGPLIRIRRAMSSSCRAHPPCHLIGRNPTSRRPLGDGISRSSTARFRRFRSPMPRAPPESDRSGGAEGHRIGNQSPGPDTLRCVLTSTAVEVLSSAPWSRRRCASSPTRSLRTWRTSWSTGHPRHAVRTLEVADAWSLPTHQMPLDPEAPPQGNGARRARPRRRSRGPGSSARPRAYDFPGTCVPDQA